MASPPVRETTIKRFLKESTEMRVGEDAIERLVELLTTIAEYIAPQAKESAVGAHRNTIMARDIQSGYDSFMLSLGLSQLSTETIHTIIDGLSNEAMSELINVLRADLEEVP